MRRHRRRTPWLIAAVLFVSSVAVQGAYVMTLPSAVITARNSASGAVLIELTWLSSYCFGLSPDGPPSVTLVGRTANIMTVNGFFDCPPPPPGFSTQRGPATMTADAGHLPDGEYTALWSFRNRIPGSIYPPPIQSVSGIFVVAGGRASPSVAEIPARSRQMLLIMALGLILIGWRTVA